MFKQIIFSLFLLTFSFCIAAEEKLITVDSGAEIPVKIFKPKKTKHVLLWIPTEFGVRGREDFTANELSKNGIEVWLADLHSAYFVPPGRSSYNEIQTQDISSLILAASQNSTKSPQREVILFATGRAAPLAMKATRQLQLKKDSRQIVKSAILLHPNFYTSTTQVGSQIEYLPITYASNLALYIIQPSLSGKRYQLNSLKQNLQQGGSDVVVQVLQGAGDGFNVREHDNKTEKALYKKTHSILNNAIKLVQLYKKPRTASALPEKKKTTGTASLHTGLQLYQGNIQTPYLNFKDLNNQLHTLEKHKDSVVLLNFWASWCPPCVKELPSLNRLKQKINNKDFKILAVNIGEETETVKKFLQPMSIKFSVLTDPQGKAVKPWNLLAFPSSFVLDKYGQIRYGLFGAIEWDNPQVIDTVQMLLNEP